MLCPVPTQSDKTIQKLVLKCKKFDFNKVLSSLKTAIRFQGVNVRSVLSASTIHST